MNTSVTKNQSEGQLNGGQEEHLDNDTKCQGRNCLQVVVRGLDAQDVEIRDSAEFPGLDDSVLMVAYIRKDSEDVGDDLFMAGGISLEQRASREEDKQDEVAR